MKQTNTETMTTKTATFHNPLLAETYKLGGVKDLGHAWELAGFACGRNGWNTMDMTKITIN